MAEFAMGSRELFPETIFIFEFQNLNTSVQRPDAFYAIHLHCSK